METLISTRHHHGGSPEDLRLKTILEIFAENPAGATTLDIDMGLRRRGIQNMAISTTIADLRKNGFPVARAQYIGKSSRGMKIYFYQMEGHGNG